MDAAQIKAATACPASSPAESSLFERLNRIVSGKVSESD
jgi:hypothetical protein